VAGSFGSKPRWGGAAGGEEGGKTDRGRPWEDISKNQIRKKERSKRPTKMRKRP